MDSKVTDVILGEVRIIKETQLRQWEKLGEIENDMSYLKGSLGHAPSQRNDRKELAKTGGISGVMAALMIALYEFITKLKS